MAKVDTIARRGKKRIDAICKARKTDEEMRGFAEPVRYRMVIPHRKVKSD